MKALTNYEEKIHRSAIRRCSEYKRKEGEVIESLCEVERLKIFQKVGDSTFYRYIIDRLELSTSVGYAFQNVARHALRFPVLKKAVVSGRLSIWMAVRFLSILNNENENELVEFACTNTVVNVNREVARRNPRAAKKDRIKQIAEDEHAMNSTLCGEQVEAFKRVQTLEAKKGKGTSHGETIGAACEAYLEKHDPVRKAERAQKRKGEQFCTNKTSVGRRPSAEEKDAVNHRDQGRCTRLDPQGKRCNSDKWTEIHHILPVSEGGSNEVSNLTTLCGPCHDLIHQLDLPLSL